MGEFNINLSRTRSAADSLTKMAVLFGQYEDSLNKCASGIRLSVHYSSINAALRAVSRNLAVEKSKLASLSSALENVALLYEKTEGKILGQDKDVDTTKTDPSSKEETKGAIEDALEILEEILGHEVMSFITCFVEALGEIEGLGIGVDIAAGILATLNYMLDDLQDGATVNSLIATLIVSAVATIAAMGAGVAVEAAVTSAITAACASATGGFGAAIAPYAAVIGKVAGTGASVLTGNLIDGFNEADWDRDGESNREEVVNAVETVLNWVNRSGDDQTYYLPEGI